MQEKSTSRKEFQCSSPLSKISAIFWGSRTTKEPNELDVSLGAFTLTGAPEVICFLLILYRSVFVRPCLMPSLILFFFVLLCRKPEPMRQSLRKYPFLWFLQFQRFHLWAGMHVQWMQLVLKNLIHFLHMLFFQA